MNEAQSQKKETSFSDTAREREKNRIKQQLGKNKEESRGVSTTEALIQKYKISATSDSKKIHEALAEEATQLLLSQYMNKENEEERIIKKGNKYFYLGHEFTANEIQELIVENHGTEIRQMAKDYFKIIKLELKKQKNNQIKNQAIFEEQTIRNEIAQLQTEYEKQEKLLEEQDEKLVNALYKQNKVISDARKENAQLEFNSQVLKFQEDTKSGKDKALIQGYEGQQILLGQQKQQVEQAKQAEDRHVDDLKFRYEEALRQQKAHESGLQQEREEQEKNRDLQLEIQDRNDQNVQAQIDASNANNAALINANLQIGQAQIDANARNTQAQIDANARNTQAAIDSQVRGTNAIVNGLNQIGANIGQISNDFKGLQDQFKDLNKGLDTLGKKINTPPAPPPIPPSCISGNPCDSPWHIHRTNATSKRRPGDGPVTIWYCQWDAHWCASNGEHDGNGPGASSVRSVYNYFNL